MVYIENEGVYKIVNAQTPETVVDLSAGDGLTSVFNMPCFSQFLVLTRLIVTGYPYNGGPNQHARSS